MSRNYLWRNYLWRTSCAALALLAMAQQTAAIAQTFAEPALTLAGGTASAGAQAARDPANMAQLGTEAKIALLRQRVKYVFVLFQENRSFDSYFGTYPGANGLTSTYPGANPSDPMAQPANAGPAYNQLIQDTNGDFLTLHPFLSPRTIQNVNGQTVQLYPEDQYSVDHSHTGMINSAHVDQATRTTPKQDAYALDEEGLGFATDASTPGTVVTIATSGVIGTGTPTPPTTNPSLATKQKGEVAISHIDCDTIPVLWNFADRFALLDNFHQTTYGPSTPNAIALIAGQTGETQWALHPDTSVYQQVPNSNDFAPLPGSTYNTFATTNPPAQVPFGPDEASVQTIGGQLALVPTTPQQNLTFASLPLSFMGNKIGTIIKTDPNPQADLLDVGHDIATIASKNPSVNWGWYQQGLAPEPFDTAAASSSYTFPGTSLGIDGKPPLTPHASYIVHHNGPQYFGYLGNNTAELTNMHSLGQFYTDVAANKLPASGGVFYVRGGFFNNDTVNGSPLLPADPTTSIKAAFAGNDDHASYSDSQLSENLVANSVNAIANSPYWNNSAIIITYDETDGLLDHQPQLTRSFDQKKYPLTGGPRIPTIVISPFAATHVVSHVYSEHSSVVKFINELFGLTPLADLPDEQRAKALGAANPALNGPNGPQNNLGPADAGVPMGDLLEAFDNDRLQGTVAPLPPSYAIIPAATLTSLPHYGGAGCNALQIVPTDYAGATPGAIVPGTETDPPPADYNPRPTASPGNPYLNTGGSGATPWVP